MKINLTTFRKLAVELLLFIISLKTLTFISAFDSYFKNFGGFLEYQNHK